MLKYSIKTLECIIITLFSLSTYADNIIHITVKTNEKTAAAIGYSVGGKDLGGLGKVYVGKGPKNKEYSFGYRKSLFRKIDVSCGVLTLTDNSNVMLVTKDNQCRSVIIQ